MLERKLAAVQARHGRSDFEKRHYALFALMCIYGIELLEDNALECRENLAGTFARCLKLAPARSGAEDNGAEGNGSEGNGSDGSGPDGARRPSGDDVWRRAADAVLAANIVQGDALKMQTVAGDPIAFAEWGYLGRGKYQRRDFGYDDLTRRASFQGTLFDAFEEHEVFTPVCTYPTMTVQQLAVLAPGAGDFDAGSSASPSGASA